MNDLPVTIGYDSPLDDVRRVLDAGGTIYVIDPDGGWIETLSKIGTDRYDHCVIDAEGLYMDTDSLSEQWRVLCLWNDRDDLYWSVEYPALYAGGDHAIH